MPDEHTPAGPSWLDTAAEWALRVMATLLGTVVAVASEVVAGFLTPLRIGTVYTPVSWLIVGLGVFVGLGIARYGSGRAGATALPALAWLLTLSPLISPTAAGDVIVAGTWVGYGMLLVGFVALLAALYVMVVRPWMASWAFQPLPADPPMRSNQSKRAQRPPGQR